MSVRAGSEEVVVEEIRICMLIWWCFLVVLTANVLGEKIRWGEELFDEHRTRLYAPPAGNRAIRAIRAIQASESQ